MRELPEILTAKDIAAHMRISRRRVYELMDLTPEAGGIPGFVIGASRRVDKVDFLNWIEEQKQKKGA